MEPDLRRVGGGFATRAVHAPRTPDIEQMPVAPAIQPSSTWAVDASADLAALLEDRRDGYVYGRYDNPTNTALHTQIASLHGTEAAWSFASGMAAIHTVVDVLRRRDGEAGTILATRELYGGTYALFHRMSDRAGWRVELADLTDLEAVANRLGDDVALVYAETIANPTTTVTDVEALGRLCRGAGVALVVDNTFASPYLCRPADHGATCVVESATKYLGGHGDVVAGVAAASRELVADIRLAAYESGASLGPFEAWLVARGVQTLPLRMRQACGNALAVAHALEADDRVRAVRYPGLESHRQHELARRLFADGGHGAVLAFDVVEPARAEAFADACEVFARAASLGATHSLVIHPASTTHRQLDADALVAAGIGPGLVRLAAGIEETDDLVADVEQALDVAWRTT